MSSAHPQAASGRFSRELRRGSSLARAGFVRRRRFGYLRRGAALFDHHYARSPKRARPRRTCVAPSSMATSKSSDMPIESSRRPRRRASSARRRKTGRTSSGEAAIGATVIRPRRSMFGRRAMAACAEGARRARGRTS